MDSLASLLSPLLLRSSQDATRALATFEKTFSHVLLSVANGKSPNMSPSLAYQLLSKDYADQEPSSRLWAKPVSLASASATSNTSAISTKKTTLKTDLTRRANALACANIVEKAVVEKVELAIAPLFQRRNNSDDDSFNRCRATYGLEVGRFVNGRILGMKQTRRQVRMN